MGARRTNGIVGRLALAAALVALEVAPASRRVVAEPAKPAIDVASILRGPRERHHVPGMAAAVVSGWDVAAIGADGVRKAGTEVAVTVGDLWHLGSCTKAMTATLCAILVDRGKLSWDRTLGKAFPDVVPATDAGWRDVTLEDLLVQRSGVPGDLSADGLWARLWRIEDAREARRALLSGVVAHPPKSRRGSTFEYANANFAIAGHMVERAMGVPWEQKIEKWLFDPLGIETAGFGAPGAAGKLEQPWGHRSDGTPVDPGDGGSDNPIAIGPAGRVHMTIGDWAKFVALHLRGAQGDAKALRLVSKESFGRLHTPPPGGDYAMGWVRREASWTGGPALWHNGSNTMWYCETWIAPKKDVAILVTCNRGGDEGTAACDEGTEALAHAWFERSSAGK